MELANRAMELAKKIAFLFDFTVGMTSAEG
jgi:hypothetical protein